MCEMDTTNITIENFNERFPKIRKSLEDATFISVDLEFSGLFPLQNQAPSLFDTSQERYNKLRKNIQHVIPLQLGLTAFSFDSEKNSYQGKIYNFYLMPAAFSLIQKSFMFQASSINFLKFHGFDFNKFAYSGIPFLNRSQEEALRNHLNNDKITPDTSDFETELECIFSEEGSRVKRWYAEAKEGDKLSLLKLYKEISENYEMLYFVQQYFRRRFRNVWTLVENNDLIIVKLPSRDIIKLDKENNLDEEIVRKLLGFTRVFKLITSLQKPLVGHNVLQDLLIMIENFECPLPNTYSQFKKLATNLFPAIYDTKHISREIKQKLPLKKQWRDRSLQTIYEFLCDGEGKHLTHNTPKIEFLNNDYKPNYHEAGWDSYCAGYIFLRMGFWNISHVFPEARSFRSNWIFSGFEDFKNRINVIRCSVHHIKLDGEDPKCSRPPCLVIETRKKEPLNIPQITEILRKCGFVDIQKFPRHKERILVAFDNRHTASRIINEINHRGDYVVMQYSIIKHTWVGKACIAGGFTLSVILLALAIKM